MCCISNDPLPDSIISCRADHGLMQVGTVTCHAVHCHSSMTKDKATSICRHYTNCRCCLHKHCVVCRSGQMPYLFSCVLALSLSCSAAVSLSCSASSRAMSCRLPSAGTMPGGSLPFSRALASPRCHMALTSQIVAMQCRHWQSAEQVSQCQCRSDNT